MTSDETQTLRALSACSGDVHVARVVVHAVVGLMLVLIARVIVIVFCRRVSVASFL